MARIHQNIISLRKQRGLTQRKMAEQLNISESTYNRLENAEIDLAYQRHLIPIAKVFDMEVEDLFMYQNERYIKVQALNNMRQAFANLKQYFE